MKKFFLLACLFGVGCCFLFYVMPKNDETIFNVLKAISSFGVYFKSNFYNSCLNLFRLINKYSQIDINISPDYLISIDFAKDFSIIGILKLIVTIAISPYYLLSTFISFWVALVKSSIDTLIIIFNAFVPLDDFFLDLIERTNSFVNILV